MKVATLVNSKTEIDLIVKLVGSSEQTIYKLADIESITQLDESLMSKQRFDYTSRNIILKK